MKIYIAGPMRNIKHFNFPTFDKARDYGKSLGHEIISPADLDRELDKFEGIGKQGLDEEWIATVSKTEAIKRDCLIVSNCEAIALLPGWQNSSGSRVEIFIALFLGLKILNATTFEPYNLKISSFHTGFTVENTEILENQ